jgi:hypothetical protein
VSAGGFEAAEFSDARRRSLGGRGLAFLGILLLLAACYAAARDVLYDRLVHGTAQRFLNDLFRASIERLGRVEVDSQGDLTLHDAEAWTSRDGERRLFFRAEKLRLTLDGDPMRDRDLKVMRVDLFRPEIRLRRGADGEWNLLHAIGPSSPPAPAPAPTPAEDPWKDYRRVDESWPRNGVHLHDGTIQVAFAGREGRETSWKIDSVNAMLSRKEGRTVLDPCRGGFYGGALTARAEVERGSPFTLRQFSVSVKDAEVARMAAESSSVKHPMRGRFNAVLAVTVDPARTGARPIAAGRAEVTEGDLWEMPALSKVIHLLTLTPVSAKRIDTGILEFTVEQERIRIDRMHFLGYPVSLFGEGACSVSGDWMEVVFVPRLGKDDWNSILPIIGAPIDLLSNVVKGALVPVVLSGSFDRPEVGVEPLRFLRPSVKQLIEERSPR